MIGTIKIKIKQRFLMHTTGIVFSKNNVIIYKIKNRINAYLAIIGIPSGACIIKKYISVIGILKLIEIILNS